ncbi:MAG: hypothetical protein IT453_01230 [Planctomycetes bacterium]|nr:hypothetical protein [Planctomycetota bacterium]
MSIRSAWLVCVAAGGVAVSRVGVFLPFAVATLATLAVPALAQERGDLETLLDGVHSIAAPGVPGPIAVFDERAFAVVAGRVDGAHRASAAAAARVASGRVLLLAHSGFASTDALREGDTTLFVRNAIQWLAPKAERPRIGVTGGWSGAVRLAGFTPRELDGRGAFAKLDEVDVVATTLLGLSNADMASLQAFVERGGGLLGCDTGWGWQQLHADEALDAQPIQIWLAKHGLAFTLGYLERTHAHGFAVDGEPLQLLNGDSALDLLIANAGKPRAKAEELAQASFTVGFAARALPDVATPFGDRLARLVKEHDRELVASEAKPLGPDKPLLRALASAQWIQLARVPPDSTRAHASAAEFPGSVTAESTLQSLELDLNVPGWHSTGLWANPGARIVVQLPSEVTAAGLRVRIGAHQDELWDHDAWRRMPAITREFPLAAESTTAANPFGGLVYVVAPEDKHIGRVRLVVRGAIQAPLYVLGETNNDEWRAQRRRPGPWAELASSKLVISVPSRVVRELDDPKSLMVFWDRVLDAQAELAGISAARPRPERFVLDRQIGGGYMHSGYPIMTHLDVAEVVVDRARLETGEEIWGFVHELGHNLQVDDWTFEGTGEVTNNVFSVYSIEKTCKLAPGRRGHGGVDAPPSIAAYLERGARFEEWKEDPFLALQTYLLVQAEFGWEPFRAVFAEYAALPDAERPKTEADKRDQWMVRLSRAVGKDLGPYFQAWGVPVSAEARQSVAELDDWMPASWPTK